MISKIFVLICCLMVLNCSMVSAKATRYHLRELDYDGRTVNSLGEVECKNGEDICYYYAKYYAYKLNEYIYGCANKSVVPTENNEHFKLSFMVNDDPTRVCVFTAEHDNHQEFYCKCENNLCNDYETPLHMELQKMYQKQTKSRLNIAYDARPTVASVTSVTKILVDYLNHPRPTTASITTTSDMTTTK